MFPVSLLSSLLLVVVVSLSTPILCFASVIKLFHKTMVVLRFCVSSLVWVYSIRRCVVSWHCQSLTEDLDSLAECWCTKIMLYQSLIGMTSLEFLRDWCCSCPSARRASTSTHAAPAWLRLFQHQPWRYSPLAPHQIASWNAKLVRCSMLVLVAWPQCSMRVVNLLLYTWSSSISLDLYSSPWIYFVL